MSGDFPEYIVDQPNSELVRFWSSKRLSNEPKGWLWDARQILQRYLQEMEPKDDQILHCEYISEINDFVDVENILVYNVRSRSFIKSAKHGITIKRNRSSTPPTDRGDYFYHYSEYRFNRAPKKPDRNCLTFQFTPTRIDSVFDIWLASTGASPVPATSCISERFGLFINLEWPDTIRPASKLKKLVDGILCSLHKDAEPCSHAIDRLSKRYGDGIDLRRRLSNPPNPFLSYPPQRRLVRPFRQGVQWHPADNLCEQCTLLVQYSSRPHCAVSVYPVN